VTDVARYFPVRPSPFRFQAGLHPFGTDFGNGAAERRYFQFDEQCARYLAEKRAIDPRRHRLLAPDAAQRHAMARVLAWLGETLAVEHPALPAEPPATLRAVGARVQEDLVVIHRGADGTDAAIGVDVSFPSDWRPDRIVGTDFRFIHGPVPGFADDATQARAIVTAMIERGPYVRFVWTLKADDRLDHHPERGPFPAWSADGDGFLRVERQITVPFPEVAASLFLIRTYLYPFAALDAVERATLDRAVQAMPEPAATYKGFAAARDIVRALLARHPPVR
jgi:hypothetical protein